MASTTFTHRRSLIVAATTLCLASAAFVGWSKANGGGANDGATIPEIRLVRTIIVDPKPQSMRSSAVGEVRPQRESDFGFRVAGKLVLRNVSVGTIVRKGDLLGRIDDQDYRNRLRSAEADQRAALAAKVEAAASEARIRTLLEKGYTTRANHDAATKNLQSALAKLEAMDAALDMAKDQLSYTQLHADFDGVVTATAAEEGQVVNTGQTIVRVADPSLRDAVFSVSEAMFAEAPTSRSAASISVSLLSNPSVIVRGLVREVATTADAGTRTYQVKVSLPNAPASMRFGASVSGTVETTDADVVTLPGSALFDTGGKPAVWLVGADDRVSLRPVVVGRYETDRVLVSAGLAKGDIVVTAGVNRLRDQQKVRIQGEPK